MAAIAELRARQDAADGAIERLDERVTRHDEIISSLREAVAKVATKDDISALRQDVTNTFYQQLRDANSSVPGKIGVLLTGGSLVIMLVSLYLKSHG